MSISRRRFLSLTGAGLAASSLPSLLSANQGSQLTIWGPPIGPSITLAHVAANGTSRSHIDHLDFKVWRTPDQLRSGIISGDMQLSGIPSYVGANLYNKGIPVQLMNILTWGLLYIVSTDGSIKSIADIAGKTITMPFKNDMPDLVFKYITEKAGMVNGKDFTLNYASTPLEVVQMMLSGRADICILPEPAATAAMLKGHSKGLQIHRSISIQEAWGEATGGSPRIPQAGLLVNRQLVDTSPDLLRAIQQDCVTSSAWAINNPAEAGVLAQDYIGIKAKITEKSMPFINLDATPAQTAKKELESFFAKLAELSPAIIGGKLPDNDFYLDL
ncbi:MAG: ABC transporter substrate-binding protein [Osedax symbiont Rs1]|nr:MAG: ABC transporter substrate-binding protein [Osedax symbiont Rs1]